MTFISELYTNIRNTTGGLSTILIFDTIYVDSLLHFILGQVLYLTFRYFKLNSIVAFLLVVAIAFIKELHDSYTLQNEMSENISDFLFTILLPTISLLINKKLTKRKLN